MYNDYYLQSIDNRLTTTNNELGELNNNTLTIINTQQQLISGDREILQNINLLNHSILLTSATICFFIVFIFIVRCFK